MKKDFKVIEETYSNPKIDNTTVIKGETREVIARIGNVTGLSFENASDGFQHIQALTDKGIGNHTTVHSSGKVERIETTTGCINFSRNNQELNSQDFLGKSPVVSKSFRIAEFQLLVESLTHSGISFHKKKKEPKSYQIEINLNAFKTNRELLNQIQALLRKEEDSLYSPTFTYVGNNKELITSITFSNKQPAKDLLNKFNTFFNQSGNENAGKEIISPPIAGNMLHNLSGTIGSVFQFQACSFLSSTGASISSKEKFWNISEPAKYFTGRENYHSVLTNYFHSQQRHQNTLTQVIVGTNGVGKTQLLLSYAETNKACYAAGLFLQADSNETLSRDLEVVLESVETSQQERLMDKARNAYQMLLKRLQPNEKLLIVLDNARDYESIKLVLPNAQQLPSLNNYWIDVVITSTNQLPQDWGNAPFLTLDPQTPEMQKDAVDYIIKLCKEPDEKEILYYAQQLADRMGYLALGVSQAAAYIHHNYHRGMTIKKYLTLFEREHKRLLEQKTFSQDNYQHTVMTAWNLSLQAIKEEMSMAEIILSRSAFCAPDTILLDWFSDISMGNDEELEKLLNLLESYSLMTVRWEEKNSRFALGLHLLLQTVIRIQLKLEEKFKTPFLSIFFTINQCFRYRRDNEVLHELRTLFPHAQKLLEHGQEYSSEGLIEPVILSELYYSMGVFLLDHEGNAQEAASYLEKACKCCVPDSIEEAKIEYQLANAYLRQFNFHNRPLNEFLLEKSKKCQEKALVIFNEREDLYKSEILRVKLSIANRLVKEKNPLVKEYLHALKEDVERDEDDCDILNDKAWLYHSLGTFHYEQAKSSTRKIEHLTNKQEQLESWQTQLQSALSSELLMAQQEEKVNYQLAEAYYTQSLCIKHRLKNVREAARTQKQLGSVCFMLKKYNDSEKWHEQALKGFYSYYGNIPHQDIYLTQKFLAESLFEQGKKETGIKYCRLALEQATQLSDQKEMIKLKKIISNQLSQTSLLSFFSIEPPQKKRKLHEERNESQKNLSKGVSKGVSASNLPF